MVVPAVFAAIAGGDSDVFGALFGGSMCVFLPLAMVYSVAVSVLFSAAMTNYAMKSNFGALFELGAIMDKVRGGSGYFTAWLFTIVIAFIGSAVTSVLTATAVGGILTPAVTYFTLMASGHVLGQWAATAYAMRRRPRPRIRHRPRRISPHLLLRRRSPRRRPRRARGSRGSARRLRRRPPAPSRAAA